MNNKQPAPIRPPRKSPKKKIPPCVCADKTFNTKFDECKLKNKSQFNGKCGVNGCTNQGNNEKIVNKSGHEFVTFLCKTHYNNKNTREPIRLWDIQTKQPVMQPLVITSSAKEESKEDKNLTNLYYSFIEWLANKVSTNNKERAQIVLQLKKMNNLHEIVRYMAELGLLTDSKQSPFKQLDSISKGKKIKTQSMTKLRKTHKELKQVHKRIMKRKGTGGLEVFLAIGEFFMAIINAIIKLVELIIGAVNEAAKREEERRQAEMEQAEREQREKELNQMLYDYNNQLRDLSKKANMNVRDYILVNLKDDTSKVSDMKRTILAKATDFNMTQPDFVDYCLKIAGTNSWWNVAELLKVMKAEFDNPGIISTTKVKAPLITTQQDSALDDDEFDSFDDDDEPIYANAQTLVNSKPKTNKNQDDEPIYANAQTLVNSKTKTIGNLKKDIGKILPTKKTLTKTK